MNNFYFFSQLATRQHGNTATRQHGNTATRQHGNTATRQHGKMARRQDGYPQTAPSFFKFYFLQKCFTLTLMTFLSFPYAPRTLQATESRLKAIMDAARLGLKGDRLAIAAGMMPTEYRQLCQFDPIVEYAEMKARTESEMAMSQVLHNAALEGDIKAATTILQNQHDWVAKQQINVEIDQRISISQALEMAQSRTAQVIEMDAQDADYTEVPHIKQTKEKVA